MRSAILSCGCSGALLPEPGHDRVFAQRRRVEAGHGSSSMVAADERVRARRAAAQRRPGPETASDAMLTANPMSGRADVVDDRLAHPPHGLGAGQQLLRPFGGAAGPTAEAMLTTAGPSTVGWTGGWRPPCWFGVQLDCCSRSGHPARAKSISSHTIHSPLMVPRALGSLVPGSAALQAPCAPAAGPFRSHRRSRSRQGARGGEIGRVPHGRMPARSARCRAAVPWSRRGTNSREVRRARGTRVRGWRPRRRAASGAHRGCGLRPVRPPCPTRNEGTACTDRIPEGHSCRPAQRLGRHGPVTGRGRSCRERPRWPGSARCPAPAGRVSRSPERSTSQPAKSGHHDPFSVAAGCAQSAASAVTSSEPGSWTWGCRAG